MPVLLLSAILWLFPPSPTLTLRVSPPAAGGSVRVAVYGSPADWEAQRSLRDDLIREVNQAGRPLDFHLRQLPAGSYALALYQDSNDNGRLDTNTFGIPTEPYAFSREPDSKWRTPRWEEISRPRPTEDTTLSLELRTWRQR